MAITHNENDVDVLAQENKIAMVVTPDLGKGQVANRTAVLATGLAAHHPEIIGANLVTADGLNLLGFTKVPIVVLVAKDSASIPNLFAKCREQECTTLIYLSRAQGMRSYAEYTRSVAASPAGMTLTAIRAATTAVNIKASSPIMRSTTTDTAASALCSV